MFWKITKCKLSFCYTFLVISVVYNRLLWCFSLTISRELVNYLFQTWADIRFLLPPWVWLYSTLVRCLTKEFLGASGICRIRLEVLGFIAIYNRCVLLIHWQLAFSCNRNNSVMIYVKSNSYSRYFLIFSNALTFLFGSFQPRDITQLLPLMQIFPYLLVLRHSLAWSASFFF